MKSFHLEKPSADGSPDTDQSNKKMRTVTVVNIAVTIISLGIISFFIFDVLNDDSALTVSTGTVINQADAGNISCNVAKINIHGALTTYGSGTDKDTGEEYVSSDDIVAAIEAAERTAAIKAMLIEIDSPGGSPVGAEEIAAALKEATKPTVAMIRASGMSAAYYVAAGADTIFAATNSLVGKIGVRSSYVDNAVQNQRAGLTYNQLSLGALKDAGDPNKPLTATERAVMMRNNRILYDNFIRAVAENRHLDIAKVRQLADGADMPSQLALDNGLIDQIGGIYEVESYLKSLLQEDVIVCR